MPSPETPRLVVFDFDGTLADTWRDIATALNQTLGEARLPLVEGPEVRFWIGDGALKLLQRAVPEAHRSRERIDELYARFRVHYAACCLETTELYPGIPECLEELSSAALAIASNKPACFLEPIVAGLGLKMYFRLVLGGDSLDVRKPDPAVLEHLVARIQPEPSALYVVGDSAVDVELGRARGARTIGCAWGLRGRDELRRARADTIVEHPREIPRHVLGRAEPRPGDGPGDVG
ncbi:MAG: HAD family hydrolase [Myxococcota bacterium]